ncbi:ATP-grasp domain-containing protein [Salinactinospora qingdaonensis]|uniref:ATP-grasp domain-containing protein n=1 Tax=Salinactinospora qingdaonensis TaxID=702744 RepID=A0ABP7GFT4_9ACTN
MRKNIFVLGLDELNLRILRESPHASQYRFHGIMSQPELRHGGEVDLPGLLEKARSQLDSFDGHVDAIIGYWDFPVTLMLPLLRARYGLPGASLESVLKCEHKYWSRLEQRKVISEIPRFGLVRLSDTASPPPGVRYPMWLKPVKSMSSMLAFLLSGPEDFAKAVGAIRPKIGRIGKPFEFVLSQVELPPEIAAAGGMTCLAEESVTGRQVTLEGYSFDGEVRTYGVVDSFKYPYSNSFLRYQYPSSLPEPVIGRMTDITARVVRQVGLSGTTFNVEFFWDAERDTIKLLEINPRHSQSHAPLFAFVDGIPNHECMVSLALGHPPDFPHRQGRYAVAAKYFLRRFTDGFVRSVPSRDEVARVQRELPGTIVDVVAREDQWLSELPSQDSYSFELARVFVAAHDENELRAKYEQCVARLPFTVDDKQP